MNEYRLTRDAAGDLLDVFLYGFETFGLVRAEEYRESLTRCFTLLADNPRMGRKADELAPGARRLGEETFRSRDDVRCATLDDCRTASMAICPNFPHRAQARAGIPSAFWSRR